MGVKENADLPSLRDVNFYASSLLELHESSDAAESRAAWRLSMTALAQATTNEGPGPLEGLNPEALAAGVRAALRQGLVDDLDWLAPAAAGSALYELASALPLGMEQRELGRRVLARIVSADAETFATIARRMALGSGKGLASAAMRARVALVTELPIALGVNDGPLALAIASRRDLAREWIAVQSTGSLPSRRLAARLLERAAWESARRVARGDDHSLRVFKSDAVGQAWDRLLADRESLVWRHVAVARGLLAPWVGAFAETIEKSLAPSLSPTEWRRAAASLSASVAVTPGPALALLKRALGQGLLDRDPGAASALVWGVARASEAEEDAAHELVDLVLERAQADIGEAVLDLRADLGPSELADRASRRALDLLRKRARHGGDDGAEALAQQVARDLEGSARDDEPVRDHIARALEEFVRHGAREAYARSRRALAAARGSLQALQAIDAEEEGSAGNAGSLARRTSFAVLRDLDMSLLEREVLGHLLSLGGGTEGARTSEEALDAIRDQLADWILSREEKPLQVKPGAEVPHVTLPLRRLRALLHLADGDVGDVDVDPKRAARLRGRTLRITRALLNRFESGPSSPLRRTIVAGLSRALDAMVRVGVFDAVDALLVVVRSVGDPEELRTVSEASMDPDLVKALQSYTAFAASVTGEVDLEKAKAAFDKLASDVDADSSGHGQALRAVLVRLGAALGTLAAAPSLRALAGQGGEPEAVAALENALPGLAQLAIGARARLDPDRANVSVAQGAPRMLRSAVSRVATGAMPKLTEAVVSASLDAMLAGVPKSVARLVSTVVWRLAELPVEGEEPVEGPGGSLIADALPSWLPARRTLGGFYVSRALSAGALGSVFVATRVEEKGDLGAERFALKVPEYSASAARQLSEAEFLKMFREEAGALIALPHHPNLARFVTFDAGSKPKPILVMELVEGVTLEHVLQSRSVDGARAVQVLGDVLKGLEAMHSIGVGHLDLKPSNVVIRDGWQAVLVDFGLAGRHLRPGCATGPYGAPEVWGALEFKEAWPPAKADIYAFGCITYETLMGRPLFDAPSEMTLVSKHIAHDGMPPPVKALADRKVVPGLAELLHRALRRSPHDRPTAAELRRDLAALAPALAKARWPVDAA